MSQPTVLNEQTILYLTNGLRLAGDPLVADMYVAQLAELLRERNRLVELALWALGRKGDFPVKGEGEPTYWWRRDLHDRFAKIHTTTAPRAAEEE